MKQLVIMPGGFHPFHAGHLALYQSAEQAFPGADVKVAATNDTSSRPFPFALKEKLAQLAGVAPGNFYQVKSPFRAEEITQHYDPATTQLIFVRSEKDATKPPVAGGTKKDGSPAYLQPISDDMAPMNQHAYMVYLPTVEFGPGMTSATEIRSAWPTLNEKRKTALVMSLYPATQNNPKLAATVVKMLDTAMGTQDVAEGLDEAVGGNYLYHATGADGLKGMLSSGSISQAKGPQKATQAQTAVPTVSVTRDWGYASGSTATQQSFGGIGRHAVIVLDRNAVESNFKTLGTSQSHDIRGLPRVNEPELAGRLKMRAMVMRQPELKGQNKMNFGTAKAGGEFEEAVVVPKGALPLKGTMVGFWVNPKSELMKDPAIMNDPRRLDMPRPNQFVKAAQPQGVVEAKKELPQWKKDWYAQQKPNSWPKHPQPYHNPEWIDELPPEDRKKLANQEVDEAGQKFVDPELYRTQQYAKQHYPGMADPESAFDKWVSRSLMHSDKDDHDQDKRLQQLAKEITAMKAKIQSLQQTVDYLDESR